MIDFSTKINSLRPFYKKKDLTIEQCVDEEKKYTLDLTKLQSQLESDRNRIITSASIRRLQQKTQVFPLERDAGVRSRLTHSLEVQQNGRYIVKKIFESIKENKNKNGTYGLDGLNVAVESIVEMACLMHDIGNPPFGHFGETAINDWFSKNIKKIFHKQFKDADNLFYKKIITDLESFEGNAQAIRLIFTLQKMNLTFSQSACILKYTRPAWEKKVDDESYIRSKVGYYLSEEDFVKKLYHALDMKDSTRYPFTYIMEAADDIAYCFADIEDAVVKGLLTIEELKIYILDSYKQFGKVEEKEIFNVYSKEYDKSFEEIINSAFNKYENEEINKISEFFISLRLGLLHDLVKHSADRFILNIKNIYEGNFNKPLLKDDSPSANIIKTFKYVCKKYIFIHKEIHEKELQGYIIINNILDRYKTILQLSEADFTDILDKGKPSYHMLLIERIGNKYIKAYKKAVEEKRNDKHNKLWELYFRCRMIQDQISGMNDQFAHDEYKILNVKN